MASSIFKKDLTLESFPIAAGSKILTNDITFTEEELSPGGSGSMRLWIAVATAGDTDTTLEIGYDGSFDFFVRLSADNNFVVKSRGLYRFDLPIRPGINFNIRSSAEILFVDLFFLDKIVFGA